MVPSLRSSVPVATGMLLAEAPVHTLMMPLSAQLANAGAADPNSAAASSRPDAPTFVVALEPLRLPRALVVSETATHAPMDAFHMLRKFVFI
jgi:hypothetical protein